MEKQDYNMTSFLQGFQHISIAALQAFIAESLWSYKKFILNSYSATKD